MKTLIAFNPGETGDTPKLYLIDGDFSHLNYVVLSSGSSPEGYSKEKEKEKEKELARILFGDDGTGRKTQAQPISNGPIQADVFIRCSFVP